MIAYFPEVHSANFHENHWSAPAGIATLQDMNQSRNASDSKRSAFVLSDAELQNLFLAALDERERAILELLGLSGLRIGEVCQLEIARVDLVGRTVTVLGKGGKERIVPIGAGTAALLGRIIGRRRRGYVFEGKKGAPHLSVRMAQYLVRQAGERIQFQQKAPTLRYLNPHTLRHTAARRMKARGFDWEAIARILGHEDVFKTVTMYGTLTFKEIQEQADAKLFKM